MRTDNPVLTQREADKGAIKLNGGFIVVNGTLIVTPRFKAKMAIDSKLISVNGAELVSTFTGDDMTMSGEYWAYADVIYTDILRVIGQDRDRDYVEPEHRKGRIYIEPESRINK